MSTERWLDVFTSTASTFALTAIAGGTVTWLFSNRRLATSYRIAVLGFPRCGKTTLITALFAYLFRKGIRGASIVPRGEDTIQRINSDLEQLEMGFPMKPTTDQEVVAYRADVKFDSPIIAKTYKLEIGDFPGEDTLRFTEQYGNWLHKSNYFEWAISADAFIFVLDTGAILDDNTGEYVARQKSAFRAAWQRLQDQYSSGPAELSTRPLLLVFTKADTLLTRETKHDLSPAEIRNLISSTATEEIVEMEKRAITNRFSDLLDYFTRESKRFNVVFTSVYFNVDGNRLGIAKLARFVMPRRTFWPTTSIQQPSREQMKGNYK